MYSAQPNIRAAMAFLVVMMFSCGGGVSQTATFARHPAAPLLYGHSPLAWNSCAKAAGSPSIVLPADAAGGHTPSCDATPAVSPEALPCRTSAARTGCARPSDPVQAQLDGMGKAGQKIFRAREKVLEILQNENTCRAWFEGKDSNPAATFRTLNFVLDLHGDEFILESRDTGPMNIFRNPYAAKVIQGDGPNGVVTLNTKGAFFSPMARVLEVHRDGGPSSFRGTQLLHIGPYAGDTLPAQVVTLLHEFGHLLDILPTDQNDVDGKSVQNTNEVLRFCSAEVDSLARRGTLAASQ
jgi:hypothetical protein